ncbi:MAG: hypothetical protein ACFFD1_16635 [Candidatus Thorarchaeota archaeon]
MSQTRANGIAVAAGATVRDVLFTTEQDPYVAERTELVDVFLTQVPGANSPVVASIKAGSRLFADRIGVVDTTGRTPTTPVTSQDPYTRVGLRRGDRLKIEATNTGANPSTLNYLIQSAPVR